MSFFRRKAIAAEGKVQQLEVTVQQARQLSRGGGGGGKESDKEKDIIISNLKNKLNNDSDDNVILKSQINELKLQLSNNNSSLDRNSGNPQRSSENKRLREENEKLRQELSAFDLDFFEEIENLKYAHSEAIKKLKLYEGSGGGGRDSSEGQRN